MSEIKRNRAIWRSKRGLLELDLFLHPFAKVQYDSLTTEEQRSYDELLGCDDVDILDWIKDTTTCPARFHLVIQKIAEFQRQAE